MVDSDLSPAEHATILAAEHAAILAAMAVEDVPMANAPLLDIPPSSNPITPPEIKQSPVTTTSVPPPTTRNIPEQLALDAALAAQLAAPNYPAVAFMLAGTANHAQLDAELAKEQQFALDSQFSHMSSFPSLGDTINKSYESRYTDNMTALLSAQLSLADDALREKARMLVAPSVQRRAVQEDAAEKRRRVEEAARRETETRPTVRFWPGLAEGEMKEWAAIDRQWWRKEDRMEQYWKGREAMMQGALLRKQFEQNQKGRQKWKRLCEEWEENDDGGDEDRNEGGEERMKRVGALMSGMEETTVEEWKGKCKDQEVLLVGPQAVQRGTRDETPTVSGWSSGYRDAQVGSVELRSARSLGEKSRNTDGELEH